MKTLFVTATAQTLANYHTIWHLANHKTDIDHIVIISTEFSRKKNFVANLMALLQNNVQFEQNFAVSELFLPNGIEENNLFEIKKLIHDWLIAHQPKALSLMSQVAQNLSPSPKTNLPYSIEQILNVFTKI